MQRKNIQGRNLRLVDFICEVKYSRRRDPTIGQHGKTSNARSKGSLSSNRLLSNASSGEHKMDPEGEEKKTLTARKVTMHLSSSIRDFREFIRLIKRLFNQRNLKTLLK